MAEILSPGVFIEELPAQVQVIAAVSTSNLGMVGFTKRGPTDKATLVTSFETFTKIFGGLTKDSFVPLSMAAFFSNGGRRAFISRVVPSDATSADCKIQSQTTDQQIETGDGVAVAFAKTAATSALKDNTGASPLVGSSVSVRWRGAGVAVVAAATKKRDGTTALVLVPGQAAYDGRIDPTTLPAFDAALDGVVRGTVTVKYSVAVATGGPALAVAIPVGTSSVVSATIGTAPNQSTVIFDHRSGRFSILTTGNHVPAGGDTGAVTADFTPATATNTITDNGAGVLNSSPALTGPGAISYADGSYSFTTTAGAKPHNLARVLATYKINAWDLDPVSKGKWGNDLRVDVVGNRDFFDAATASYTRFDVTVLMKDETSGLYVAQENYSELSFDDPSNAQFFADVLNELSDLLTVVEPAGNEAPGELSGVARTNELAGGDGLAASQTVLATLTNGPLATRSVVITYTDSTLGTTKTITDNGVGKLVGDVDGTGNNTIDYTTGAIDVKLATTAKGGTLVLATYRSAVVETRHTETFGDTTKGYTVGTDGTFTTSTYGRDQISSPTLITPGKGVYALSRIEEIMQVAVPDFAGDVTITGDLLDYADGRATAPPGGDRFIVLTTPKGQSAQEAVDWFRFTLKRFSKFAALYWPWVKVADPLANNRPLTMPALGHVAGVYARTDSTKNVAKSPGGTVDGALRFLTGLELEPNQGERDLVYPNKINPLISTPQSGLAVWGVRTIALESEWRYISVRRLFMFLERSIFNATHWVVFENNGPALWTRIKAQLNGFLTSLFNEGFFAGATPAQAFFVVVDETNNTQASIDLGQVIIDVGIATNKPAEFVRFRFQQATL